MSNFEIPDVESVQLTSLTQWRRIRDDFEWVPEHVLTHCFHGSCFFGSKGAARIVQPVSERLCRDFMPRDSYLANPRVLICVQVRKGDSNDPFSLPAHIIAHHPTPANLSGYGLQTWVKLLHGSILVLPARISTATISGPTVGEAVDNFRGSLSDTAGILDELELLIRAECWISHRNEDHSTLRLTIFNGGIP